MPEAHENHIGKKQTALHAGAAKANGKHVRPIAQGEKHMQILYISRGEDGYVF